ncbi:UvrD-helicase domain-containing protein [bacterium]|nr:UvrD-helicase domain-containing protein [bacterium]
MESNRWEALLAGLTPSQRRAVILPDNIVLRAAAGSGKTTVLVARFLRTLNAALARRPSADVEDILPSIVAMTFTKKAAAELKMRIRDLIPWSLLCSERAESAAQLWRKATDAMTHSGIGTIHSLCANILRKFPLEAGLDPEFSILDETESRLLMRDSLNLFISELSEHSSDSQQLDELLSAYSRAKLPDIILPIMERIDKLRPHLIFYAEQLPDTIVARLAEHLPPPHTGKNGRTRKATGYDPLDEAQRLRVIAQAALGAVSVYSAQKRALAALDFDDIQTTLTSLLSRLSPAALRTVRDGFTTIMIDEFQDTNSFQWGLARLLSSSEDGGPTPPGKLFVVGDSRQSIYGFRDADLRAFRQAGDEISGAPGGLRIDMRENFRAMPELIDFINLLFKGAGERSGGFEEGDMLPARRTREGGHTGTVELIFPTDEGSKKEGVEVEAEILARRIATMCSGDEALSKVVFDKKTGQWRRCRFEDVAVLMLRRTHLASYQAALRRHDIPFMIAGGLGFYQRQEVRDIYCLLRVLTSKEDEVALAGVLCSPLFSLSDDGLFWLSCISGRDLWSKLDKVNLHGFEAVSPWVDPPLDSSDRDSLTHAFDLLDDRAMMIGSSILSASSAVREMLSRTAALSAYSAQPDGDQAVANLEKLLRFLDGWELKGNSSPRSAARLLRRSMTQIVREGEAQSSRDDLKGVRVMTIHAAKGLEFPVVLLTDVFSDVQWGSSEPAYIHSDLGIGIKVPKRGSPDKMVNSGLRDAMKLLLKEAALDEQMRLWYVACTRARDHLVLSGTAKMKAERSFGRVVLDQLELPIESLTCGSQVLDLPTPCGSLRAWTKPDQLPAGLKGLACSMRFVERARQLYGTLRDPEKAPTREDETRLKYVAPLPARDSLPEILPTHLARFYACPRRFFLEHILSPMKTAPSHLEGDASEPSVPKGAEFGTMAHRVLQMLDISDPGADEPLVATMTGRVGQSVSKALAQMVQVFRESSLHTSLLGATNDRCEVTFALQLPYGLLRGTIDRLFTGQDGRLHLIDYKTDIEPGLIASRYRAQIAAYAFAISKLHNVQMSDVKASIYLTRTGEIVPIGMDEASMDWIQSLIRSLSDALQCARKQPYVECFPENRDACKGCHHAIRRSCLRLRRAAEAVTAGRSD